MTDRATVRARSRDAALTAGERREARRALVKLTLRETLPEGSRIGVAIDVYGTPSHQRISDVSLDHVDKHAAVADVLAYPKPSRHALAAELAHECAIVPLPSVEAGDASAIIDAHRESAEAVGVALAKGLGSLDLRKELREAVVALLRLEMANEAKLAADAVVPLHLARMR